jgi:hypothetical protein
MKAAASQWQGSMMLLLALLAGWELLFKKLG